VESLPWRLAQPGIADRPSWAQAASRSPGRATLPGVNPESPDGERLVNLSDDDLILPEPSTDDTDAGWGERSAENDDRLLDERPPHWE
jgi:hypothetical protein